MSERLLIVIGLFLAGVVGLLIWQASGPREPVFEDRTLTRWLDHHVASSAADPPYDSPGWKKADEALRHIGTNAIPTLLKMIRAKDPPPVVLRLLQFAARYRWTRINYRYAQPRQEEAEYAFRVLGTNAANAVPELIKIYEEAVPPSSQRSAALALGHIGRGAQAALPALFRNFTHTNGDVRFYAVSAVMHIGGEPGVVVPALTSALKDSNVNVRWNALAGLSNFGGRARSAVPDIVRMLNDPGMVGSDSITQQVETALWRIAPEKVGKPLVVEDATPMIANDTTIQALKLIFHGKRQTLIPPGRPVPAIAQYWNSDPRPRLTLYRGASASEDTDHFLGHFEVLGLPASDNLNVSTLCIVANEQIILCARDNHRDVFLEIRRVETEAVK
ncbi:MAG: HEAT repeat domain-containing protein [Verrucomicrobia bacterium]|nr:HEAT repeat domain-containing protein [Verrucomicrobiota bacterium]